MMRNLFELLSKTFHITDGNQAVGMGGEKQARYKDAYCTRRHIFVVNFIKTTPM